MPHRCILSCRLPVCCQSQPQEEACCFTPVCSLMMRSDALHSSPPLLSLSSVCTSLTCLKAWSHIGVNAAPQSVSSNCQCVCRLHHPASPLLKFGVQFCFYYRNNPAGLTSLPCTISDIDNIEAWTSELTVISYIKTWFGIYLVTRVVCTSDE